MPSTACHPFEPPGAFGRSDKLHWHNIEWWYIYVSSFQLVSAFNIAVGSVVWWRYGSEAASLDVTWPENKSKFDNRRQKILQLPSCLLQDIKLLRHLRFHPSSSKCCFDREWKRVSWNVIDWLIGCFLSW